MTLRVVEMYQKGELDASIAMQLLGGGLGNIGQLGKVEASDSNKRPRVNDETEASPNADDDAGELDDLLHQAKKTKMESWFNDLKNESFNNKTCFLNQLCYMTPVNVYEVEHFWFVSTFLSIVGTVFPDKP